MNLNADLVEKIIERYDFTDWSLLDISHLNIVKIDPDAFEKCRSRRIRSLNLQCNKDCSLFFVHSMTSKNPNQFTSFSNEHLNLFEPLEKHLIELDLSNNLFQCSFNFLHNLKHLQKLILKNCIFLSEPMFNASEADNQLLHLDLSRSKENRLMINNPNMFNDLKRLKHLDLSGCELDHVLPALFNELKQLETLKLNETYCYPRIYEECFRTLEKNLKEFELSVCNADDFNLKRKVKLEKLTMSQLPLSADKFDGPSNLRHLNLHSISSLKIGKNFFDKHKNLESVHLSAFYDSYSIYETNKIHLDAFKRPKSLKSIKLIDLNLNLDAGCPLFVLAGLEHLDLSLTTERYRHAGRLIVWNECTIERMKKLTSLNLSGNRIQLDGDVFKNLPSLKELNLSNALINFKNDDYDMFASLHGLEIFKCFNISTPRVSFKLHKLSTLVNLKELDFNIKRLDLYHYRDMLRKGEQRQIDYDTNPITSNEPIMDTIDCFS